MIRSVAGVGALLLATAVCASCGPDPVVLGTVSVDEALDCTTEAVEWPDPALFEVVGLTPEGAAMPLQSGTRAQLWSGPSPVDVPAGGQVWLVWVGDNPLGVALTMPADPATSAAGSGEPQAWGGRFVLSCPDNKFRNTGPTPSTQQVAIETLGLPEAQARTLVEDAGLVFQPTLIDGGISETAIFQLHCIQVDLVKGEVRRAAPVG